jgi:FkbM family methyltransferase
MFKQRLESRGVNLFRDVRAWIPHVRLDLVFDVGANTGQSLREIKANHPDAVVHCFEPVRDVFERLEKNASIYRGVHCYNCALGSAGGRQFIQLENESVLCRIVDPTPGETAPRGRIEEVEMQTLDLFCHSNGIKRINYLKIDAEGHDLEVLKGAQALLAGQQIDLLQVEAGINPQNALHVPLERFKDFLSSHNYHLFGFYDQCTEWPTGEPHLRRVNAVFVSSKVIQNNRHSTRRVTGLTRIKSSLVFCLKRAMKKASSSWSYCQELCSEVLNQAAFCRTPSVMILPSRIRTIW